MLLVLGALAAFAPLSIDMYLPAFPAIEGAFAASTGAVQTTLATFFVGFALGQALYGPVTDAFGRKAPLYVGLAVYVAASAGCALAPSVAALAGLRFVQAVGACAGAVISRAVVRDVFTASEAPRIYGALMLVTGLAPILAPLLGGWLLAWFGWQAIFWALAVAGALCLVAVWLQLPETHPPAARRRLALVPSLAAYARLLADRGFVGYALSGGLAMAGMFAYIAGSPFVFIQLHGVPPERYGWLFGANALGLVIAAQANGRVRRPGHAHATLRWANVVQAASGLVLLATAAAGAGGLAGVALPLFVYVASLGFVLPNATALAMAPHGANAGVASALLGTLQFSTAALAATAVGALHDGTATPMALVIAACGAGALAVNLAMTRSPRG
jgi:DHA1 family bicyclomycin/chloramphenicol resistance-like MFS transporter